MKNIKRFISLTVVMPLVAGIFFSGSANGDGYNPNNIIDDAVFNKSGAMTPNQIDTWLNSFSGSCLSTNSGFSAPEPIGYNPTNGFLYGSNVSAGQVIYDAAQVYSINPQVLLVTLQKEQGLVDGSGIYGCSAKAYAAAAGYGCPDGGTAYSYSGIDIASVKGVEITAVSNTCVNTSLKTGFSQQVIRAAWLLKFGEQRSEGNENWNVQLTNFPNNGNNWNNSDDSQSCYGGPMTEGTFQICPNDTATFYDGYTTIDGQSIHMDDGATATLYWYTPHLSPNKNFWTIFSYWFGATTLVGYVNTLNFVRTNYYSGNIQLVGYSSINSYSYTNRLTTIPYPDDTTTIPLFRPNGDLSLINLNDPSGKVKVTTFSIQSNFQQLSSIIYVPYPTAPNNGSVVPMFRPNGDLSFIMLNNSSGHVQVVTYSFSSYFQQLSSNIITAYPAVTPDGSVVPMFQPNEDFSLIRLNYYAGNAQVVTYSFGSYYQIVNSQILTGYPSVSDYTYVKPILSTTF